MTILHRFAARALAGVEELPPLERADMYQVAARVLEQEDPKASAMAAHTAVLLREAQRHQLEFLNLLLGPAVPAATGTRHPFGPSA